MNPYRVQFDKDRWNAVAVFLFVAIFLCAPRSWAASPCGQFLDDTDTVKIPVSQISEALPPPLKPHPRIAPRKYGDEHYDLKGHYAKNGDLTHLGYGRHLYVIVKMGDFIFPLTVPLIIVPASKDGHSQSSALIGTHQGLREKALQLAKESKNPEILPEFLGAGELFILGESALEIYGRSGYFHGDKRHLDFAVRVFTQLHLAMAPEVKLLTYQDVPVPPPQHLDTFPEGLQLRMQIEQNAQWRQDEKALVNFIAFLHQVRRKNKGFEIDELGSLESAIGPNDRAMRSKMTGAYWILSQANSSVVKGELDLTILRFHQEPDFAKSYFGHLITIVEWWLQLSSDSHPDPFFSLEQRLRLQEFLSEFKDARARIKP